MAFECRSMMNDELRENSFLSSTLVRFARLAPCLSSMISEDVVSNNGTSYALIENDGDTENSDSFQKISKISEVIYYISSFLSPPEIMNLVKSSRRFECLNTPHFWNYYNSHHQYTWNIDKDTNKQDVSPKKIAFSCYWFSKGMIVKAASVGYPTALTILKTQKDETIKKEIPRQHYASSQRTKTIKIFTRGLNRYD